MITKLTIEKNGSYAPNRTLVLGNKFDNLSENYLVFDIPEEFREYNHYVYGTNGNRGVLLPCNWVSDENGSSELRLIVGNTITRTPGLWQFVFIASIQEIKEETSEASILKQVLTQQRFISNMFLGQVFDNNLSNPPISDVADENLDIYYDALGNLMTNLEQAWQSGNLNGPYYKPRFNTMDKKVELYFDLTKTVPPDEEKTFGPFDIKGDKGDKGEKGDKGSYYEPVIADGKLTFKVKDGVGQETSAEFDVKSDVEGVARTTAQKVTEDQYEWIWDSAAEALYIYGKEGLKQDDVSEELKAPILEQLIAQENRIKTLEETVAELKETIRIMQSNGLANASFVFAEDEDE